MTKKKEESEEEGRKQRAEEKGEQTRGAKERSPEIEASFSFLGNAAPMEEGRPSSLCLLPSVRSLLLPGTDPFLFADELSSRRIRRKLVGLGVILLRLECVCV